MTYRVYITLDGRWAVRRDDAMRASKTFARKRDAVGHGASVAWRTACRLVIHRSNGMVESTHTFQ